MAVQRTAKTRNADESLSIRDLLSLCVAKWSWFVVSLAVTLGIAIAYLLVTPPVYVRTASMVIKEDSKGKSLSSDVSTTFSDLGLFQTNTNINNELISLRSPAVMLDVIKRLHLDVDYETNGSFYRQVLYGSTLPYTVTFADLKDNETASFTLNVQKGGSVILSDFTYNGDGVNCDDIRGVLSKKISTPVGVVVVEPVSGYAKDCPFNIYVSRPSLYSVIDKYSSNLSVALSDEQSTVIDLSFKDVCIQRAEDLLNTLISIYNENWMKDKNQIAVSTSMFINDRLKIIESELGNVDQDISSYKSVHLLPDVQTASSMYMAQNNEVNAQIQTLNTQLSIARYIRSYVSNTANRNQLLPANSGLDNGNIEKQISDYNTMQLQRNNLVANSSEHNPLVIDLDQSLKSTRGAIVSTIDNLMVTINTQIRDLQQQARQTTARIADNPTQEKYILSVERQQKVKESLYLFLLQKREENELSQAFTAYNSRIITPPTGTMMPASPVKRNTLLVAFVLGILIPTVIIFLIEIMNTAVRGRKDLESLTIPFAGEIPLSSHYRKKRSFLSRKKREELEVVVKARSRNVINEAFRVVRTNLEFMVGKNDSSQVFMLSSANAGSGKTFISINLAISFALKGKRALVIDLDLRRASLSAFVHSPSVGVSDYLNGQEEDLSKIIFNSEVNDLLDIIPVGTMPPNPTELLFSERLESMLHLLRAQYDYIFIDCPPAEIVADASIINKHVDMTLFIVRVGLLDRRMLPDIEELHSEHKLKNMTLILNGIRSDHRYGYHKYGYHYGYAYGGYTKEE